MKQFCIIIGILIFLMLTQFSSNFESSKLTITEIPTDFEYDGCSLFPDGNYLNCCIKHDDQYFFGGNWKDRFIADLELSQCVQSKGGVFHKILGPSMFLGVRIGGAPIFPSSFRWGFGRDTY